MRIPPTGMTVDSVHFKPNCSKTGCWVIKGVVTTGEAFNAYEQFNTFFLPQANITGVDPDGDLSYDYDYAAVEWTFQPANHPCTSAAYNNSNDTSKISTCCITDPTVTSTGGGFVANYRPTEAFVEWAGQLTCDAHFETEAGSKDCYKVYTSFKTWPDADLTCKAAGGKLAVIENSAQQDLVAGILQRYWGEFWQETNRDDYRAHAWINLVDANDDDSFTWADGNPATERFWHSQSNGADENCAAVAAWSGRWYDYKCTSKYQFVCQFSPPTWNKDCVEHVIQRPKYTAPTVTARKCWDAYDRREAMATGTSEDHWAEAQAFCEEEGGFLARVESPDDVLFMGRFLAAQGLTDAWIGAREDDTTPGALYWGANSTTADP
eukprot:1750686-Rhodomonas_salina.1